MMRTTSHEPGRQLHSVALRFRQFGPSGSAPRPGWWRLDLGVTTTEQADADEPGVHDPKVHRLEAVLFIAREPLSSRKLSEYANLADGTEARTLIRRLNQWYDQQGRAFRVEEVAGGYQLLSRPKFASWLRRLAHVPAETRLSAPVLETLAVIAYRQPVLRADIEAIRGVNCGEILRQLMERDLVRISGRSQELGRPYLYATTKTFLQLFGLPNIDKLPRVETMRNISEDATVSQSEDPLEESEIHLSHSKREESDVTRTTRELPHHDSFEEEAATYVSVIRDQDDEEEIDEFEEEEDDEEFEDDYEDEDEDEDEEFDDDLEGDDDFEGEEEDFEDEDEEFEEEGDDFDDEDWEEVEDDEEEDEDWDEEDDDDWGDDEDEEEEEWD